MMQHNTRQFRRSAAALLCMTALLAACGGGDSGDEAVPPPDPIACTTDPVVDSWMDAGPPLDWTIIQSHDREPIPVYGSITTRYRADGTSVDMDYMVHDAIDPVSGEVIWGKALLVQIAGGQMTAGITGSGTTVDTTGGNFVVRTAHLFAQQGYRVITIDQPSDAADWNPDGFTNGVVMDRYRVSPAHAVDIVTVINEVDQNRVLPVILVGTSRGTISAVAQTDLADALALSSPVTVGGNKTGASIVYTAHPVGSAEANPAAVNTPAQVLWHTGDACEKSPPAGAWSVAQALSGGSGVSVTGGFNHPLPEYADPCGAFSYHGYLGIESCAVSQHTGWMDALTLSAPDSAVPFPTLGSADGAAASYDLASWVGVGDSVALPHGGSTLGGSVTLTGSVVTYTPPSGLTGTTDTFVYVIRGADGSLRQGVIRVSLS